uniref:Cysteine protease n=1 Tax=Arcella intermedia TaxID=1963864 RepID=A0A6B2LQF5_9EUKA
MIPVRLGTDKISPVYLPHIKYILASKFSVGIIGGKPRASLYFIGYQGDYVIYLDPHFVQPAVPKDLRKEDFETYQCKVPLKMPLADIDPSLAIGFFIKTEQDFEEFIEWQSSYQKINNYCIFTLSKDFNF